MSDSPSPTPIADPNSGLSPEEIAENDLCDRMSSPSPGDGFDDDQLALDQDSSTLSSELLLTSAASMHNELVVTHRKATQLKLHPYQCTALEEFVKGSSNFKQMMFYAQLCAVENHIVGIKTATPPFSCSPQLLENIRSFVLAVLLSSKLSVYKKDLVPVGHIMTVLTSVPRSYMPDNLHGDTFALKTVKRAIQDELTQIKTSLATLPSKSDSIFDLASTLVANTQSTVTVPLCARITLLWKVLVESSDVGYWDKVDTHLQFICSTADGVTSKITRAFEYILQTDRDTYGDNTYTLSNTPDVYQSSVDNVVGATA